MGEVYGERLADVYDTVYSAGRSKDYAAEVAALVAIVRSRRPAADSLLDVACGTGEHLRYAREHFRHVEGLELSEPMRAKAVAKLPGVVVHSGDMRQFALGRSFDVVTCLFSAIGYTGSLDEMRAALRAMADHLSPGGVLIVDPWFYPDAWHGGRLDHTVAIAGGRTVLRLAQSRRHDRMSRVTYHYLVGDADGVHQFTDQHDMMLYTRDEYVQAIRAAGCVCVEYAEDWAEGRHRIVATRALPPGPADGSAPCER